MGDANLVNRIGSCLTIGIATIATAAILGLAYLGFNYVSQNASRQYKIGDSAIVFSLKYSPYETLDSKIKLSDRIPFRNEDYIRFDGPTSCTVDDTFVRFIPLGNEQNINYRLRCPGQKGNVYGWSGQSDMSQPEKP